MDIIVCVKQVPDTTEVQIDPETGTLVREGVPSIVNPFDLNAVEAALQLKEEHGGTVTVITMGPPQAKDALKECLAMGADEAVLISDKDFAGADTWATSYTLAKSVEALGNYDLVLCGKEAIDGDTAQTGPGIAEHLGIPQVTYLQKIVKVEDEKMQVERVIDGGAETVEVPLPALMTCEKSMNEPRYATIKGTMKANKKEIPEYSAQDIKADPECIGLKGSPTKVKRVFAPEKKTGGEIIEGEPKEAVQTLVKKLQDANIV
ncbi:electron transfer flavoprotein subunit beta/FixA family protein [Natranaerofaba carboxydovora]|uniref:electron transfer flavoprotein subunit beta/FixA family protein n=1 Tax=Natranaerofaba carboxydovora TaxID=2742683 RepID=UPI001F148A9C|nr:electron transfer flavoprotein subunit beta/FixA family protein [Natranaerofaba carboxydovora]UMZ73279.1 Caffeyl-CoA reductase-Etf complex subunit CarD [Natranaerofaba carboxydovora]